MDIKNLKQNSAAISAGQWVGQIPNMGDLRLKVRGMGSAQYGLAYSRRLQALTRDDRDRDGTALPSARIRVTAEALHEAVLLDWDGLESGGKPLAYDSDQAFLWLTDPDYVQFVDAVLYAARVVDNGRAEVEGTTAGN